MCGARERGKGREQITASVHFSDGIMLLAAYSLHVDVGLTPFHSGGCGRHQKATTILFLSVRGGKIRVHPGREGWSTGGIVRLKLRHL